MTGNGLYMFIHVYTTYGDLGDCYSNHLGGSIVMGVPQ